MKTERYRFEYVIAVSICESTELHRLERTHFGIRKIGSRRVLKSTVSKSMPIGTNRLGVGCIWNRQRRNRLDSESKKFKIVIPWHNKTADDLLLR